MNYTEWEAQVERIRVRYYEGAITARDYFNAVIAAAFQVEQTPEPCASCGVELPEGSHEHDCPNTDADGNMLWLVPAKRETVN